MYLKSSIYRSSRLPLTLKLRAVLKLFSILIDSLARAPATSKPLWFRSDEVGDFGLAGQVETANHLLLQTIGVGNALVLA